MFIDYIELCTTTPHNEKCVCVGDPGYLANSRLEANAYIDQLKRTVGENPAGTSFKIVSCSHDFGTYHDIRFRFDEENDEHLHYMQKIETGLDNWDQLAINYLVDNHYPFKRSNVIPFRAAS